MTASFIPRRLTAALAGAAVALSGLVAVSIAGSADADPGGTGLVISEVYGAGGNSGAVFNADFVELYNPTNADISLSGRYIHYRAANGNPGGNPVALSGSVPAHGNFLIQMSASGANGSALPAPDQGPLSFSMAAAGGQVFLLAGSTNPFASGTNGDAAGNAGIVDMVGASGALTFEAAATSQAASPTQSLNRSTAGADTDNNTSDFALAGPSPTSSEVEGDELTATGPADSDAFVGQTIDPINLEATGGTSPYSWDVTGLPAGLTESSDGVITGAPTTAGSSVVTATVTDSAVPTAGTDAVQFTINVLAAPEEFTIAEIQGTGDASTMVGDTVTTEGVVTAKYAGGPSTYNGVYVQTAGSGGTTTDTPGASDAIFVFGNNSQPAGVEIGDSVEVTGEVSEFSGTTEITPGTDGVVEVSSLGTVAPRAVVPGTDCALPGTGCLTGPALNSAREAFEGELFQPTGDYTVTDVNDGSAYNGGTFSSSFFGEIGLAAESELPLITPTELIDAQDTAGVAARKAYNDAHRMILDDGASVTYWNTANTGQMDQPFPWFTNDNQVRVGAAVAFPQPVVMEWRNGTWKLQPQSRVTDSGADRVAFEQDRPAQPEDVGGDLKLATFNVLNYFTTLGEDFAGCTSFNDRAGNPIAVNSCPGNGPRGAWNEASFLRQQAKIVHAINTIDADIVSVEEIENSLKVDNHDRDEALSALVDALNADAGAGTWDYVRSPASASDPSNIDEQDVIRTGFIYQPATVDLVGAADMLFDAPAFENAREPFAQAFKAEGADDEDGFAVIVNHFKSKGSGVDDGTGQGNANPDRIAQAEALSVFAGSFAAARDIDAVFLSGDFNSNSMEDPMQVLYGDGYIGQEAENKWSYNFDGQSQSLDHVLGNSTADAMVTGVDIWQVNANETVFNQYSRFNYNVTNLYTEAPYSASDHNPEIIGIDVPDDTRAEATVTASHTPHKVKVGKTEAKLRVVVSAAGHTPTGTISVTVSGHDPATAELDGHGRATIRLPAFDTLGDHVIEIAYEGDEFVQDASVEYTVQVVQ